MELSGTPLDYVVAFAGGVLLSFTPCVYPLIPLTCGFIGASSAGLKRRGFLLSLVYVTGVAVVYSGLGIFASVTGNIFGSLSMHPLTDLIVGLVVLLMGIYMLDIIHIRLPQFISLPGIKRKGYLGAFLFGAVSALVISPCLTPVLGSILFYLAKRKDILYGATLLFVFSYGIGLLLIIVGTFSGALANLPKSGKWSVYVKRVFACLLIFSGLLFIYLSARRM